MKPQPSIGLGTGGDNSPTGTGEFFEGAVTKGFPTDATENAVQFHLLHNPDGSVGFRAYNNQHLVTAENAGTSALIANRTAIVPWEEFDLIAG